MPTGRWGRSRASVLKRSHNTTDVSAMTDQAVRCDACLFEHPTGAGFVRKKGRIACGPCVAAEKRRRAGRSAWLLWALFALTALSWFADAPYQVRYQLTGISIVYVVAFGMTAIHEGAHALAALSMGIRVRSIEIGAGGPVAASVTRGLFSLRIRVVPLGGLTRIGAATRAFRTRHMVVAAAGPLAELLVVALVWSWDADGWMILVRDAIFLVGAFDVILNLLIPLPGRGNDSSRLIDLLRMPEDEVAITKGVTRHDEIVRRLNQHDRGNPLSPEELDEIRHFFLRRLADPALTGASRGLEASNLSAVDMLTARPDLLAEADELSAEAYDLLPIPEIATNRGSVLVALGRDDEAVLLISRALPELDASSRDSAHADLALAAIRRGDLYGARHHFVNISPDYDAPSVREARCLLGPAELSNVLSVYWTDGQPPAEIAAVIRSDAGGDSTPIGHVLRIFSKTADAAQIEAVFAEHGRNPSNATAAVVQLAASLEEQPGDPARRE